MTSYLWSPVFICNIFNPIFYNLNWWRGAFKHRKFPHHACVHVYIKIYFPQMQGKFWEGSGDAKSKWLLERLKSWICTVWIKRKHLTQSLVSRCWNHPRWVNFYLSCLYHFIGYIWKHTSLWFLLAHDSDLSEIFYSKNYIRWILSLYIIRNFSLISCKKCDRWYVF